MEHSEKSAIPARILGSARFVSCCGTKARIGFSGWRQADGIDAAATKKARVMPALGNDTKSKVATDVLWLAPSGRMLIGPSSNRLAVGRVPSKRSCQTAPWRSLAQR